MPDLVEWREILLIKLALTDLDDTLIPFGSSCVSTRSRAAIHAALDAGVRCGPVTGRLPADMTWMFAGDDACYATGAFANGQIVCIDGNVIKETTISAALLARVERVLDEHGGGFLCLYDPWELGKIAYVTNEPERLRKNPPPTYGDITWTVGKVWDFPTQYCDSAGPAYVKANIQTTCSAPERSMLAEYLRDEIPDLDFVLPSAKAAVIDIVPFGWNKGSAVYTLAGALGLLPEEIAVFGDSENDLAMIEAVKNSIAVANASAAVNSHARWHIGLCNDGAVDDALFDIASCALKGEMPTFMADA